MSKHKDLKLVTIGSVSAASLLIKSFPECKGNLTAIVPTTDTGSSTGIIRKIFSLPAPGDVRAVLAAMADEKGILLYASSLTIVLIKASLRHYPTWPWEILSWPRSPICREAFKAIKVSEKLLGVKERCFP